MIKAISKDPTSAAKKPRLLGAFVELQLKATRKMLLRQIRPSSEKNGGEGDRRGGRDRKSPRDPRRRFSIAPKSALTPEVQH